MRHVHGFGQHAQLLRSNQRQRSVRARKIDAAHHHGKGAILLQPAEGRGGLRSTWPAADGHTYPNLPAFQILRHLLPGLLALRPQRVLLDLLKALQQADARPTSTHDTRVTLSESIDLAELKRIHPKL